VASLIKLNYSSQKLRDIMYRNENSAIRKWLEPPFSIDAWRLDVANMTGNRQLLNNQFAEMNRTAGSMAANLHERSKPMKIMPFSMQPLA
jgi:glycosidase